MIPVATTTVRVDEDSALRGHSFVARSGEPVAWLGVGVGEEVGVYGSADAMRRLAEALLAAAESADRLLAQGERVGVEG